MLGKTIAGEFVIEHHSNAFFHSFWLNVLLCSIINAVKTTGGLRERLFNAAYNAKKRALLSGKVYYQLEFCVIVA